MRDHVDLLGFWQAHRGEALALCTLVHKSGSAYRRPGAKKILSRDGGSCGLLSGGCLEADIERVAHERWNAMPFIQSFSTQSPEDKIFGYQKGCAGVIDVLFEKLPDEPTPLYLPFGTAAKAAGVVVELSGGRMGERRFGDRPPEGDEVFFDVWQKPIQLFIAGCGLDAVPFSALAAMLGWQAVFFDYRESLRANLPVDAKVVIAPLDELAAQIVAGPQVAVVLMTHNFSADLALLKGLASQSSVPGYVGCLGPRARYDEMLAALDAPLSDDLSAVVHAPAGLFTNSHAPEAIALSITGQIQALMG